MNITVATKAEKGTEKLIHIANDFKYLVYIK